MIAQKYGPYIRPCVTKLYSFYFIFLDSCQAVEAEISGLELSFPKYTVIMLEMTLKRP